MKNNLATLRWQATQMVQKYTYLKQPTDLVLIHHDAITNTYLMAIRYVDGKNLSVSRIGDCTLSGLRRKVIARHNQLLSDLKTAPSFLVDDIAAELHQTSMDTETLISAFTAQSFLNSME